jgi:hypothetical protein
MMAKSLSKSTTDAVLVSARIAAAVIGLSRKQFDRLTRSGVIPRESPRTFNLVKVGPAYFQYVRDGRAESSTLAEARLKHIEAQRRSIEQRSRERSGELIERAEVRRVFSAAIVTVGASLDGLPGRLSGMLAAIDQPARIHEVIADEARRIRNAAAEELDRLAARERGEPAPAAAEANS